MTSVLSPAAQQSTGAHNPDRGVASSMPRQDTLEYLADMLRELSAIAAWAELENATKHIDAALQEVQASKAADCGRSMS